MDVLETLRQSDGGSIAALAGTFGLSVEQADAVVASVVPEVSRRIERNTLSRGGVADLVAMLASADTTEKKSVGVALIGSEDGRNAGNAMLEQIFGSRDASRAVAARAAASSGIPETIIRAMLPYIANLVIAALARRVSGGLGDILSRIPNLDGGGSTPPSRRDGGLAAPEPMPIPAPSRSSPLPGPEGMSLPGRNPYGELSDIIRRGGSGASIDGSPLWRIVRNVLGAALGFQSRGIVSWLVRLVVMRYGWGLLRSILRRMLPGR